MTWETTHRPLHIVDYEWPVDHEEHTIIATICAIAWGNGLQMVCESPVELHSQVTGNGA